MIIKMKGLLLKDFYILIKNFKLFLIMDVIFMVSFLIDSTKITFLWFEIMTIGMIPISLFNNDEHTRWNEYSGTLPCSKTQIVSERYLFELLLQCLIFIIMAIAMFVSAYFFQNGNFIDSLSIISILHVFSLLLPTLYFPFCMRFGVEKGRIAYYLICGPTFTFGFTFMQNNFGNALQNTLVPFLPLILCGIIVLFILSWAASILLYRVR